uniref:BZIP domain-containing protein n=1 Tax=Nelumbo nucifera TaxID=4432 RepID=A0A822XVN5_NELNU|nr:TPA_asm: hypothetical protein HUJ06_025515 [Nelumbo nucifera]
MINQLDRHRTSVNLEIHRLKNRVRQQKCRARKRKEIEKAKRNEQTLFPPDMFTMDAPNLTNASPELRYNIGKIVGPMVGTNSMDIVQGDIHQGTTHNFFFCLFVCLEICKYSKFYILSGFSNSGSHQTPLITAHHQQQNCGVLYFGTDAENTTDIIPTHSHTSLPHKILQSAYESSTNAPKSQDNNVTELPNQSEQSRFDNDLMARRLKNRERQRRYRARKRLEADKKKASLINQSTMIQEHSQLDGSISKFVTRVRRERDWKKDARRAHVSEEPEIMSTGLLLPAHTFVSEDQSNSLPSEIKVEPPLEGEFLPEQSLGLNDIQPNEVIYGWRDWKAAARSRAD